MQRRCLTPTPVAPQLSSQRPGGRAGLGEAQSGLELTSLRTDLRAALTHFKPQLLWYCPLCNADLSVKTQTDESFRISKWHLKLPRENTVAASPEHPALFCQERHLIPFSQETTRCQRIAQFGECGLNVNPKLTFLSNSVARVLLQLINDFTKKICDFSSTQ